MDASTKGIEYSVPIYAWQGRAFIHQLPQTEALQFQVHMQLRPKT
jgi:hypothetical protein